MMNTRSILLLAFLLPLIMGATAPTDPFEVRFEKLLGSCGSIQDGTYKVQPYMYTASFLQELGTEKAVTLMQKEAESRKYEDQLIVLCRLLFESREEGAFRRPGIGGANFMGETTYDDWELEPIELVDGVPFLVVQGYNLGGQPELSSMYLDYCIQECNWRTASYKAVSQSEVEAALASLLASPKWNRKLSTYEQEFLQNQIK